MSGAPVFKGAGDALIAATVASGVITAGVVTEGPLGGLGSAGGLFALLLVVRARKNRAACRRAEEERRTLIEGYQAGKAERERERMTLRDWQPERPAALEWQPQGEVITGVTVEVLRPQALPRGSRVGP